MNEKFKRDYANSTGKPYTPVGGICRIIKNQYLRYIFYGRIAEHSNSKLVKRICSFLQHPITNRSGIEIENSEGKIGPGLSLIHAWGITVNNKGILGNDVVLFKGCTIGSIRSGKRASSPVIGDRVVLACNAMVCGGIHIGNDVLIAANSFVDFDVPSNSIVIGNPAKIIHKMNPARDYIRDIK